MYLIGSNQDMVMDDKERLSRCIDSSRAKYSKGLNLLRRKPTTAGRPNIGELPTAFDQLLNNVRQTVTSLSLAFKPPISIDAAIAKLDQLSNELGQIIACVIMVLGEGWAESALGEEWRKGVLGVGEEVDRYLDSLGKGSYLEHTGMVWDLLDSMKPISTTEVQAVKKRWEADAEVIKDAWKEYKEYLEGDEPDEEGRKLALATKPLLAMHQLLHAAVPRNLKDQDSYKDLLAASTDMQAAFDTAILTVYDSDIDELKEAMTELKAVSDRLLVGDGTFASKWKERYALEEAKWEEEMSRG